MHSEDTIVMQKKLNQEADMVYSRTNQKFQEVV